MSTLGLLATPFSTIAAWPGREAPLGGMLVADIREGISPLAQALRAQRIAPWCPLCLIVDGSVARGEIASFEPMTGSFGLVVTAGHGWPAPAAMLHAIRARPRPEPHHLGAYVTLRTGRAALGSLLSMELGGGLLAERGRPSPRTVVRRFTRLGPLQPHEWRWLGELVGWVLDSGDCRGSLERKAGLAGVDQRTLRRWLGRLPGVTIAAAIERPGWEWVLEAVLRRFGYVDEGAVSDAVIRAEQA